MLLVLQIAVVLLLSMVWAGAHLLAQAIVGSGLGFFAIGLLLISPIFLSDYLD